MKGGSMRDFDDGAVVDAVKLDVPLEALPVEDFMALWVPQQ